MCFYDHESAAGSDFILINSAMDLYGLQSWALFQTCQQLNIQTTPSKKKHTHFGVDTYSNSELIMHDVLNVQTLNILCTSALNCLFFFCLINGMLLDTTFKLILFRQF